MKQIILAVAICGFATGIGSSASVAEKGSKVPGLVTACSWYGHGTCYTAALRNGRYGKQLVLRNGTKVDCGRDCVNTLREETVDFWDTQRENGG